MKIFLGMALAAAALAQYRVEAGAAPPPELAAGIAGELQEKGLKVVKPDGSALCELWFVKKAPAAGTTTESDVTWKTVPAGALVGAVRWPAQGSDRRGQNVKAGVYTLRFSLQPINGDHQGVAPQRDFLVMSQAAADQSKDIVAKFDDLMNMSRKVSGTPHPAVLSMWYVESGFKPGMMQLGEHDWALMAQAGDAKIAVILVGKAE
jgi:hypothetical protein